MVRLFGTDGVRGLANRDITADLALKLGEAAGRVLSLDSKYSRKRAIVGRDTRISGEFLSAAVCAGLAAAGVDVKDVGVLPTPGIAYLTKRLGVNLGVVISASHNAMPDNGIKFFAEDGFKLEDSVEDQIEQHLNEQWDYPLGDQVGRIRDDGAQASAIFTSYLARSIGASEDNKPLKGLKIALDASNGAASKVAPEALRFCGAEVVVINASPDGYNINEESGSTHPDQLQATVKAAGADFGVAFDGDADRCIGVDETGELIDGDKIITMLALDLKERGELVDDTVVLTVMTNLGTLNALEKHGIKTEITGVGDRYVLEQMRAKNLTLGGEQSGHIINLDYSTTGDGVLSALLLANYFVQKRKENPDVKMSELTSIVQTLPQVLVNVPNVDKSRVGDEEIAKAVDFHQQKLNDAKAGTSGRVLLRASGTEPLVRVMVEASTDIEARSTAEELARIVKERISL
ncbi:MAG: phosphoglucosamine mutase [Candidatus Ancillula sp.]|jgi:phosphoglucosamine mutase|nr:phosphoglucosamine mutase [Candidatus Ancillula sp.]